MLDHRPPAERSLDPIAPGSGMTTISAYPKTARTLWDPVDPDPPRQTGTTAGHDAEAGGTRQRLQETESEPGPATVLLVGGATMDGDALQSLLAAPRREIVVARSAATAEAILARTAVSLVVLHLGLPGVEARALLSVLGGHPSTTALPVIGLDAEGAMPDRAEWFALGVDAFVTAPWDADTVAAAVTTHLRKAGTLERRIRRDPLTGLPNAAAFAEAFEWAATLAAREREPLSIALLDLDRFGAVNDAAGRAGADELLRRAAAVVAGCFRRSDLVARWRGDTFAVLLPNTGRRGAAWAAEKVLLTLKRQRLSIPNTGLPPLSFSAGIAQLRHGESLEDAAAEASRLLTGAKLAGRDRVHSAGDEEASPARRRILLAEDDEITASIIRHRLERAGFEVLSVTDGAAALEVAPDASVALAILGVKIPGMDGFEVLRRLRSIRSFRGVPIVMMTAMESERDLVRGFELGADDYVVKPFSPVELLARVHRLLDKD